LGSRHKQTPTRNRWSSPEKSDGQTAGSFLADNQPMIFLASPDILVGAKNAIGNFHPAVLEPYLLWNVEQLYVRSSTESASR
jgi:hypothetical protein